MRPKAPVVRGLIVKRFRSMPQASATFGNPTFLVGRNGSGKSNFLDVFKFVAEAMVSPLQAVFDTRGGIATVRNKMSGHGGYPPNLGMRLLLGEMNGEAQSGHYAFEVRALPNYGFEVVREQCRVVDRSGKASWFDRSQKKGFQSSVTGLSPSLDRSSLGLPVVGGETSFMPVLRTLSAMRVYSIEPGKLREMQDPDSGVSLRADGSNAASVLQEIERHSHADMDRICEILASVVPNTTQAYTKKHGNKLSLGFTQQWGEKNTLQFEAFNMSDGTLRVLGLLAAVYQRPTPSLLAVEEPEATIHPGALGAVLDLLRHASSKMQVVVTTHSPEVLDADWIEDEHLRMVDWQEGATRIAPISETSRQALHQHLMGAGELLRSNVLEPAPLFTESADLDAKLFEDVR